MPAARKRLATAVQEEHFIPSEGIFFFSNMTWSLSLGRDSDVVHREKGSVYTAMENHKKLLPPFKSGLND